MATSSWVATPTGPQVFINFRGKDVRKNFVSFLAPTLRSANINVFIDEDMLLSTDLSDLLTEIEQSEIALVIFSKNYANSDWCLDELAKIKERKDQGRLRVIPIFYNLDTSVVKELTNDFGNNYRDLKRKHLHEPERTQKWEEALLTIPDIKGMPRAEQSETTDHEFIDKLVVRIQKLLADMAVRGNRATGPNSQDAAMVPTRQQERVVNRQGGSMVPARLLDITHSKDSKKWVWNSISEAPDYASIEVVTMINVYWLKIFGSWETKDLTPETKYEVAFVAKLEDDAAGWDQPVTLKLKVELEDGSERRKDRTSDLRNYIGHGWVDILAGAFMTPPKDSWGKITFTMYQHVDTDRKHGLVVKGVAIRPQSK
ncbi:hypothetical protein AALP_AA6G221000 [Arabis alpina]|uniref:TIR domain-containing protein n=1 Tax=Arabis alpina TaxID=50452 RepID=A0A087GQX1_ARAAL|nr:hypothetical protein AALP_AA6G221000 [Arabis alpina]